MGNIEHSKIESPLKDEGDARSNHSLLMYVPDKFDILKLRISKAEHFDWLIVKIIETMLEDDI